MANSQDSAIAKMTAPFFQAIGGAIMRWQHVEASLFALFHAIIKTEYRYSSTVFFHVRSADSKIQLVDRLCRVHFDELIIKSEWTQLHKDLKAGVLFRNGLAHFEANFVLDASILEPGEPPLVITPHHLDVSRQKNQKVKGATTNAINDAAQEYLRISLLLLHFVRLHFSLEDLRATGLPPRLMRFLETAQAPPQEGAPRPQP